MKRFALPLIASAVVFVLFALCRLVPVPFDSRAWLGGEEMETYYIDNRRYRMARWLVKNYDFASRSPQEIIDKLVWPTLHDRALRQVAEEGLLVFRIKQKDPNFIIGIDPWTDKAWLVLEFGEHGRVIDFYIVDADREPEKAKELDRYFKF